MRYRDLIIKERKCKGGEAYLVRSRDYRMKFALREWKHRAWQISWQGLDGKQRRRVYDEIELFRAIDAFLDSSHDDKDLTVDDVITSYIRNSNGKKVTKENYSYQSNAFCEWAFPRGIEKWRDVRYSTLQEYVAHSLQEGKAKRTIQLRVTLLKAASRWAHLEHGVPDTLAPYRLNVRAGKIEQPRPCSLLEIPGIIQSFIDRGFQRLVCGVALQGICGLRATEACRLIRDNIDLDSGLVSIKGETKNEHSVRTIPIPKYAIGILEEHLGERVSVEKSEKLYTTRINQNLDTMWARTLRKVLPTEFEGRGWKTPALERYIGHAGDGMLERHYVIRSPEDEIKVLREQVADRVDWIFKNEITNAPK